MNCANHPDIPVEAYCQNCGKPLCSTCMRSVSGVVYCESCLAARLGAQPPRAGSSYTVSDSGYTVSGTTREGVNYTVSDSGAYTVSGFAPDAAGNLGPNPGLAALLGFIPGVGAMYNGQFIKALVHVLVFVVLIGITNEHDIFGLFISFWVFYQVFDAYQTAKARRNGLPLPDPFGLNELGHRLGIPNRPFNHAPTGPAQPYHSAPPPPPSSAPYAAVPPVPPVPPVPADSFGRHPEPVGAVVLIVVGMLFLFSTLGIFRFDWIHRGWPIIVIIVGVWMLVQRTRDLPPPSEPPAGGGQ